MNWIPLLLFNKMNQKLGEIYLYGNRCSFPSLLYTKHFPEFSSVWEQSQFPVDPVRKEELAISSLLLSSESIQETL